MRRSALLLILVLPLFAGCLDEAAMDGADPSETPAASQPLPQAFDWTDEVALDARLCTGGTCALVVDMDRDPTYPLGMPTSVEAELQWDSGAIELGFTLLQHKNKGWSAVTAAMGPSPLRIEAPDLADETVFEYALMVWHPCNDYVAACIQSGPPTPFTVDGTLTSA